MKDRLTARVRTTNNNSIGYTLGEPSPLNSCGEWFASVYRRALPELVSGGWFLPLRLNGSRIGHDLETWLQHGESMRTTLGKIVFRKEMDAR